jgi:hypothetical protein
MEIILGKEYSRASESTGYWLICTEVFKDPDNQLTTCSTLERKCGRKKGSTLGQNCGPRARVITHLNSFT